MVLALPVPQISGVLVVLSLLYVFIDYGRVLWRRRRMPPGPFPLPLIGNYLSFPSYKPWIHFAELSKKYDSPIVTVWNGRVANIICNDCWTAHDLMEKHASENSSRPHMVVMGEVAGHVRSNVAVMPYGEKWRRQRKIVHSAIGTHRIHQYRALQSDEGRILMDNLLRNPYDFFGSIERYVASTVSVISWGRRIATTDDYVLQLSKNMMDLVDWVVPGNCFLETIPQLVYLPKWLYPLPTILTGTAAKIGRYFYALAEEARGNKGEHFSRQLFLEREKAELNNEEVGRLGFNLMGAGFDTTSSTTLSFVLALCAFPEVQKKAQEEIDRVIGRDRSPTEDIDEKSLPYVAALVQEVLRWRSVAIFGGLPHASEHDQVFRNYYFPKGTWFCGNLWAIHRNLNDFPDPDRVEPERFIAGSQWQRPYPSRKGHNAFGWGRRTCAGQYIAEQSLFLTVTRLLWSFTVLPGLDEEGKEVKVDTFDYTNCQNMRPNHFKARFIPRDEATVKVIQKEAEAALASLEQYAGETHLTTENFE